MQVNAPILLHSIDSKIVIKPDILSVASIYKYKLHE